MLQRIKTSRRLIIFKKKPKRAISNSNFKAHKIPFFGKIDILKLQDDLQSKGSIFIYEYFDERLNDESFNDMFCALSHPNQTKCLDKKDQ